MKRAKAMGSRQSQCRRYKILSTHPLNDDKKIMMEALQNENVSVGVRVCVLGWVLFCLTVATSGCKWIWSHDWIKKWVEHSADERLCEDVGDIV